MRMVRQQDPGQQFGSFLLTVQLGLLLVGYNHGGMKREHYQLVSVNWPKITSLDYLNLFSVDTETAAGVVL